MKIEKNTLHLLPKLLDQIHDRYFWISNIKYERSNREWKLFFSEKKRGPFNKVLKLLGVNDFVCRDKTGTDLNSINEIVVDMDALVINLLCNAPAEIKFLINPDFEISVVQEDS